MTANMFVRDMDLQDFDRLDGREGAICHGCTLVSALKGDRTARARTGQRSSMREAQGLNSLGVVGRKRKMKSSCLGW